MTLNAFIHSRAPQLKDSYFIYCYSDMGRLYLCSYTHFMYDILLYHFAYRFRSTDIVLAGPVRFVFLYVHVSSTSQCSLSRALAIAVILQMALRTWRCDNCPNCPFLSSFHRTNEIWPAPITSNPLPTIILLRAVSRSAECFESF